MLVKIFTKNVPARTSRVARFEASWVKFAEAVIVQIADRVTLAELSHRAVKLGAERKEILDYSI